MAKQSRPTNSDDVIDSRDVIAAIDELETEIESEEDEDEKADLEEELRHLRAFAEEADCSEWRHGMALVRDNHFEDYAKEFAEDVGAINSDATWPNNCIDWEKAARELQMDYSSAEFNGETYWYRSN